MKLFNRKPKLISRKKLRKFQLTDLIEYQEYCYHGIYLDDGLEGNKLNEYLLLHNAYLTEEQLDDVINELLDKYKHEMEEMFKNEQ